MDVAWRAIPLSHGRGWRRQRARATLGAECDLGVMLTSGLDIAQDRANGLRYLQAAARLGDGYAEDYLGQFAESGLISDPSSSEAYMHYLKASEMGSAWGAYNVARMHERGIGVYKNPTEALRWYMKVASIGDPDLLGQWSDLRSEAGAIASANFRIGDMYADGNGVPKDTHEAERWYKRGVDMESAGAQAGWLMAQVYLANAYLQSKGVPLDYGEAMHWMRKAAENGYRQAQVNLGSMYRDGQGTPQNYGEAMYWYRKAADQGSAVAEGMIGRLYFHGRGVIRDFTEAATWFRRAAEAGVPVAQWDLGMMYYRGYGVSKDLATARAWLQKAAARGYAPAKEMLAKLDAAAILYLRMPQLMRMSPRAPRGCNKHLYFRVVLERPAYCNLVVSRLRGPPPSRTIEESSRMKRIAILGSTGSIGRSTLSVVESYPDRFQVSTLAAGNNAELAFEQAVRWKPRVVSLADEAAAHALQAKLRQAGLRRD